VARSPATQLASDNPFQNAATCPGDAWGGCNSCGTGLWGGPFDGHRLWRGGEYLRSLFRPPGPERNRGLGQPLFQESWLQHRYSASWLMGTSVGGPLIDDWVGQNAGYLTGLRLGWDGGHYWGLESRLAFGELDLYGPGAPTVDQAISRRQSSLTYWDLDLLYYPWGDARWRPYWMLGCGVGQVTFSDRLDNRYSKTAFGLPIGLGVKCRCTVRLVLRAECVDNILFAFDSAHNVTFTLGVELRFGGTRKNYWPWNPGRHNW